MIAFAVCCLTLAVLGAHTIDAAEQNTYENPEPDLQMATPRERLDVVCDPNAKYRTLDGTCNNLEHPKWGSSRQLYQRWLPPVYDDGKNLPRLKQTNGEDLPSPRDVSTRVHGPRHNFHPTGSVFLMAWGQFLAHDNVATMSEKKKVKGSCCNAENGNPDVADGGACFPIAVSEGDRYFNSCLNFIRSTPDNSNGVREQINLLSAFIDASNVYGSEAEDMNKLRTFEGGNLTIKGDNNLPESTTNGCILTYDKDYCLQAGDFRVNVYPPLGAQHTMFMRYHNYVTGELAAAHPDYDDEKLFQEARKIIIAVMQHITYDEYLPLILGPEAMTKYGLNKEWFYNPNCDATLHNAFAAAAFRFGHSMIPDSVNINNEAVDNVKLYHNPHTVLQSLDSVVKGTATERTETADRWFSTTVSDRLFERAPKTGGDLVSRNIQRGRDHGLPSYNDFRRFCGLSPITSFDDLTNGTDYKQVYEDVEDIDLYSGALSEAPLGTVGETFTCLLARQFADLRDCDRFWWETSDHNIGFTKLQKMAIAKTSLSGIMCLTTGLAQVQQNAFEVVDGNRGHIEQPCSDVLKTFVNRDLF